MAQPEFILQLDEPDCALHVLAFEGHEAISEPYRFTLELVSQDPDLNFEPLLQRPAFLQLNAQHGVHGLVQEIGQIDSTPRLSRYRLVLGPQLLRLQLRRNCRIFQNKTVPQILTALLGEHGIQADTCRFVLNADYPARAYCVQYGETDLDFLQRLCAEEGLHYHFQHHADRHELVFGDDQTAFPRLDQPVPYVPGAGQNVPMPTVRQFAVRLESRPEAVVRRDHDFEQPRLLLESSARQAASPLEDYGFPGRFTDRARGRQLAQRALDAHRHDQTLAHGESDQPLLVSGAFMALQEHPRTEWNELWLLTRIHHEGRQPQVLEALGDLPCGTQGYHNRFQATPWDAVFRPAPAPGKPRLLGTQSAVVCGPSGEEIHCDALGRIKVQFHWDREGQSDEHSSCWVHVATGWAGNQYGALATPRVGMHVLLSFLEGDPDQPLVTGCLYHAEHPTPYPLPEHRTRSVFRTRSSPGGHGYNELRIEDRQGAEEIHIHAQRDWQQHIGHDQRVQVGHELCEHIGGNRFLTLQGEAHSIVHRDRKAELKADDHLIVGGSQHVRAGQGRFIEAGTEIHLSAGRKLVIDAGQELTLSAGGSWLRLDPSGISLSGPQIRLNSGGSPGTGAGVQALLPGQATAHPPAPNTAALATAPLIEAEEARWEEQEAASAEEEAETYEDEPVKPETQQRITLRIGVFFDGTGNNDTNSAITHQCRQDDLTLMDPDALQSTIDHCRKYGFGDPDENGTFRRVPDNSYGNAPTNVAELYRLYQDDANKSLEKQSRHACIRVYLEGIGTTRGKADSPIGQGTGGGPTGILARVRSAPYEIRKQLRSFLINNNGAQIESVEFDIFGFSRGAAAARHFVNEILKAHHGMLSELLSPTAPGFAINFNWDHVKINFIGLFDTVAALIAPLDGDFSPSNELNPGLNLYLPPKCARKVVHFTARDEKRWNFALNSIAPAHQEIELPGVHSDIGGGYPRTMTERLLIKKPRTTRLYWGQSPEQTKAWSETVIEAEQLELKGFPAGSLRIYAQPLSRSNLRSTASSERYLVLLEIQREVRGGLARVYLQAMHEIAMSSGVPLASLDAADPRIALPSDLESIARKLLATAHGAPLNLSPDEEQHLLSRYIHLSANWTPIKGLLINKPAPNGRLVHENQPQKDYPA